MKVVAPFAQLPRVGLGYYPYSSATRQYGTPKCLEALALVAAAYYRMNAVEIGIGDISLPAPGNFGPHKTHYKGRAADIRPLREDGEPKPVSFLDDAYSRDLTKALVETFYASSNVELVLFNDASIPGVHHCHGHDNHLHVYFKE